MHKFFLKRGFTLAEVLITIAVIGIVAALTIPAVLNYTFEREAVSKAKKSYAILSSAVQSWQEEGDCLSDTASCPELDPSGPPHNALLIGQNISKYLKVADTAYDGNYSHTFSDKPWIPTQAYNLNGNLSSDAVKAALSGTITDDAGFAYFILLQDGTVIKVAGIWYSYFITVDINGAKKPNRIGKDQFLMSLNTPQRKSFNPYASGALGQWAFNPICAETDTILCSPDPEPTGFSPMAYVLFYDKLPDLKAMGYPTTP